jgi:DNA polymerase I-like protein with 3'-5' exonuclease and polymerase domains
MNQIPLFAALEIPIKGEYYQLLKPDQKDYKRLIDETFDNPKITLDIETTGLDPIKDKIRLIQFKTVGIAGKPFLIDLGGLWEDRKKIKESHKYFFDKLKEFLTSKKLVIGHNISFDLRFLRYQYGIRTTCFVSDTMIGTQVLFGDFGASCAKKKQYVLPGGYNLANVAEKLLGVEVDKTEQKSDWGDVLTQDQLNYAGKDIVVTEQVYSKLVELYLGQSSCKWLPKRLVTEGILKAWKLENRVIVKALDVEYNGLPCDEKLLHEKIKQLTDILDTLNNRWFFEYNMPLNPGQTQGLVKYFKEKGILSKSENKLDKKALAPLAVKHPEIKLLAQIRAITALLNNLKGFKASMDYLDGRIHTQYRTLSGVGRFSSGATKVSKAYPNLQSISAKKNPILAEFGLESVRQVVKPPEGYGMAVIDLAGAHGRIAAGLANDAFAIQINNDESIDSHSMVAVYVAKTQGVSWTSDYISKVRGDYSHPDAQKADHFRSTAKNTYYGWLNGAGAATVQNQIAANTGNLPKLEDCQAALDGCKQLYEGISGFVKSVISRLANDTFTIPDETGYNRTFCQHSPEGIHHLCYELVPGYNDKSKLQPPYTKVVAATWQLIEAAAVKEGFVLVSELCDQHPEWGLKIINIVHDEIDIEFKLEYASQAITACNNAFNDAFLRHLKNGVLDGRKTDWKKLIANDWSEK